MDPYGSHGSRAGDEPNDVFSCVTGSIRDFLGAESARCGWTAEWSGEREDKAAGFAFSTKAGTKKTEEKKH